jgi:hypothetical protein
LDTVLGLLAGGVHLDQHSDAQVHLSAAILDFLCEMQRVYALDDVEEFEGSLCLVGLEAAHQMPRCGRRDLRFLGLGFLNPVLTNVGDAGSDCLVNLSGSVRLGYGD